MPELDAETLADHAVMFGLLTRDEADQARSEAEDGTPDSLLRTMLRKGLLTSWQVERLQKNDPSGFFYGGCKVLFHLAEGTFARVYRGVRVIGGHPVAIKVLRQRFVSDRDAIQRFHKEAEAGMKLKHPNIVQILDFGEEDKRHYMLMEYVEGSNLRELLRIRHRISVDQALPMMKGLCSGLQYALEHGVTHRDLKGTNILIGNTGAAKLVDFGLATIEGDDKKAASLNQRTVDYSALERRPGSHKGDPRSDIFFLGCVFYQMLSGQLAMPEVETADPLAKMLKRSFGAIKPLSEQRHTPAPELARIVEKMMKLDTKERYQTMEEVLKDLEAYEASLSPHEENGDGAEVKDPFDDQSIFNYLDGELAHLKEKLAEQPAATAAPPVEVESKPAVPLKQVLCVETQTESQDAFRKTLSKMGFRVILLGNSELAAERHRESPPDVVIFDVDGLGEEAIEHFRDMCDKAHEDGHTLRALVLLGPKQGPLRDELPTEERLIVLVKPIKMKDVQSALLQLLHDES